MELRYTFDPERFYLGKSCDYGHRWPGSDLSLRRKPGLAYKRNLVKPMKNDCAGGNCVACTGRKQSDWLLSFLDYEGMGWPANQTLGKLCPSGHKYNGHEASLRRRGACVECDKKRNSGNKREWYEKNKEEKRRKARERMAARRADPVLAEAMRERRSTPEAIAKRNAYKAGVRERLKAQGLTTHGTVPIRIETPDYMRAIRAAGRLPSVARLVMESQWAYWREHPEARKEHDRQWKQASWWLRYQTRPELRLYTRQKSKRRKALEREQTAHQLQPRELRTRFALFGNCCAYCGASGDMQIEHVIPISKGGTHAMGNIVPACQRCNYSKATKEAESWYRAQPTFCDKRWRKICRVLGWSRGAVGQLALL